LMRNKRGYFKELAKEKKKREFSLKWGVFGVIIRTEDAIKLEIP
jgi:hypothetical protein